jgi:hypothetical protein
MTFQRTFLPSFDSFGNAVSEKIFLEINQSIKIADLVPISYQTWPP